MTGEQREALHIARYALTRVVDVHVNEPGDPFPPSLFVAISAALEEIDEALPMGDLGEKPIRLRLGIRRLDAGPPLNMAAMVAHGVTPHDWPEDFVLENGNYQDHCFTCGCDFIGHKRRIVCKVCAMEKAR